LWAKATLRNNQKSWKTTAHTSCLHYALKFKYS